jgi:hypothetical protein
MAGIPEDLRRLREGIRAIYRAAEGTFVPAGVRLKAALAVLGSVGTLEPEPAGKTDPQKIESDLLMDRLSTFP